mgnify:CR=1 FL=1
MKLKKTRVASIAIAIALVCGNSGLNDAYAMESGKERALPMVNNYEITPFWNEISRISPYISASGNTLYPEVSISAKNSAGSISGTMYLEKYTSGRWTNVTSWSLSGTGNAFLSKSYKGTSGTKYRVKVVVTVNGEKATAYSGNYEL